MSDKRQGYISWDEYFMGVAELSGMRSKDPNSQVGSCIVSQDNKILSMGYNGFPAPWRGQRSMYLCFPVMSARKRSSRRE